MSAANLASGARLGPYEIVAILGAGGMGEVYRARDIAMLVPTSDTPQPVTVILNWRSLLPAQ